MTYVRQVIYGDNRLLVVLSEDTDELQMLHLNLPVSYISQNWSVQHVAASKDGMYLAIADLHGLIMYNTIQEVVYLETLLRNRRFRAKFCYGYEFLFYPRYYLDQSSLLCRK